MPLSTRISLPPSSISRHRKAQVQRLFSSAGWNLLQSVLGTTPNMAPPSSLKKPVGIEYSRIDRRFLGLNALQLFLFSQRGEQPDEADHKEDNEEDHGILH